MRRESPLVSIVTPLYNSERFILSTMQSVLQQTYQNWEHIVVDDCSTDRGAEIVEELSKKDERVKLVRLEINSGAGEARNEGIRQAKGRYIAFIDSDDLWLPDKLDLQLKMMIDEQCPLSFTFYRKIDEDDRDLKRITRSPLRLSYRTQLKTNFIGCSTAIYDSLYYGKRYFPIIRKRQDYALWLNLLEEGVPGRGLPVAATLYRVRRSGLSGNKLELVKHNWALYREVLGFGRLRSAYFLVWNIIIKVIARR